MKRIVRTEFECEVCHHVYDNEVEAMRCESKPVTHDRGVSIGDVVRVTRGDGMGKLAKVTRSYVVSPDWGPSQYSHSVALNADLIDDWGSRQLCFDSYETV